MFSIYLVSLGVVHEPADGSKAVYYGVVDRGGVVGYGEDCCGAERGVFAEDGFVVGRGRGKALASVEIDKALLEALPLVGPIEADIDFFMSITVVLSSVFNRDTINFDSRGVHFHGTKRVLHKRVILGDILGV